jgi:hypothetical protein
LNTACQTVKLLLQSAKSFDDISSMSQPAAALSARWNPLAPPLAVLLALLLSAFELKILARWFFC